MSAEKLSDTIEIYRFKEQNNKYSSICILVYDGSTVTIKALPSSIDIEEGRELRRHLVLNGVTKCYYERRKPTGTIYKLWSLDQKSDINKK
jgi:hypothetical protein